MKLITILFAGLLLSNCAAESNGSQVSNLDADLEKSEEVVVDHKEEEKVVDASLLVKKNQALLDAMNTLNSADLSCRGDRDCATVAFGHRACGGPASYIIGSKKNKNAETISVLAGMTTELGRELNILNGTVSICSIAMPPQAKCEAYQCVRK